MSPGAAALQPSVQGVFHGPRCPPAGCCSAGRNYRIAGCRRTVLAGRWDAPPSSGAWARGSDGPQSLYGLPFMLTVDRSSALSDRRAAQGMHGRGRALAS